MLLKNLSKIPNQVTCRIAYGLLQKKKMDDLKANLYLGKEKTWWLKTKFFMKQMKYTIVQGSKDLWSDAKWLRHLHKQKTRFQFTAYELAKVKRVYIDLLKFIPYSVILTVPFAQFSLPIILYLYPNAVPSFYLFDTAHEKRLKHLERAQEQAHSILIKKLMEVIKQLSTRQQPFMHYDEFKTEFFQVIEDLNQKLNYNNFTSDELITVLQFLGGDYFQGTTTINKTINFFTGICPRWLLYKPLRFLYYFISRKTAPPYQDPWWIKQNFKIFKFNYFPFQKLKRQYLLNQIKNKMNETKEQDLAFARYGMKDFKIHEIKSFTMVRGLAQLPCYEALMDVVKNDWVQFSTLPISQNKNVRLWYSVMMYKFLSESCIKYD